MKGIFVWVSGMALLVGCAGDEQPSPLAVGYSALRISLPVFVAEERGLFDRHGVEVELRRYETAQPLVEEVLDGRVLAGGFAALPIVYTAAARDGSSAHVALAMVEDAEHPVSYLLRRRGETSIAGVADLRGKRIGILPTVAYRRWLETILADAGIDPSEVTITAIAPPQQMAALEGRGVDVLFTNDPMATAAIGAGVAERVGPDAPVVAATGEPLVFGSFVVHPRLVRERPRDVDRLLAALDDAVRIIETDQAGARETMLEYVRAPERPHVPRYPDAHYLTSAELDEARLREAVRAMRDQGVIETDVTPAIAVVGSAERR